MTVVEGSGASPFQPEAIIAALNDHDVRYVVIGGMGALLHKAPLPPTKDIDITPADNRENLTRLAAALRDLDATLRVEGFVDGVQITLDERTFGGMTNMTFFTRHGPFDVSVRPDGTTGYRDLVRNAVWIEFHGHPVPVASLDDIIRSKEAAGRPKDRAVLDDLKQYQQDLDTPRPPHPKTPRRDMDLGL